MQCEFREYRFTFHFDSIKTLKTSSIKSSYTLFTFHFDSIKTISLALCPAKSAIIYISL